MEREHTVVDGTPVAWEEAGQGPAVVLVHGIPTGPALWRHVTPRLTGRARTLAFEMVGYADSIPAGRDRDISVRAQARYLNAWLDELGIDRAVLVGHDLGGGVAQIAAVERPQRCAGLVLTNAISYDSWPIPSVAAMRKVPRLVAASPPPLVKATVAALLARGHDDPGRAREALTTHFRPYAEHGAGPAMARQVSALHVDHTVAVADRLPHLRVPARVVWGLDDQFQQAPYGERLARALGTRPWGIRGGKHFTPEDHPEQIAAAVLEVVDEASPR